MARIHVLSDLHMASGAWNFVCNAAADMVILAGDIASGVEGIKWAKAVFPSNMPVVYVPGNHEYYHHTMQEMRSELLAASAATSNIHVLDRNSVTLRGVRVIGATLWTDYALLGDVQAAMKLARQQMNDHKLIRYNVWRGRRTFTPDHALLEYQRARWYLRDELRAPRAMPLIVVTHHAPSRRSVHPKYAGDALNPAFASDMELLIKNYSPALWVHGHTHTSFDYKVEKTRVLCNPRGYRINGHVENAEFDPALVVDV